MIESFTNLKPLSYQEHKGNFQTSDRELNIVTDFLVSKGFDPKSFSVEKYSEVKGERAKADVKVEYNGKVLTFEVKEFSYQNTVARNRLNIDTESAFSFKSEDLRDKFKSTDAHPASLRKVFNESITGVNGLGNPKLGTLYESEADIWLFSVQNPNGTWAFLTGYDFHKMREPLINKVNTQFDFRINLKKSGYGKKDTWESAYSVCKPSDLKEWVLNSKIDIENIK